MATRSQAQKPAGRPVLPRKETARPAVGRQKLWQYSIGRVKRLLLCLAVGPWGSLLCWSCHSGTSQQQGLF